MSTERSPRTLLLAGLALTLAWLPAAIVSAPQPAAPTARIVVVSTHHPRAHARSAVMRDTGEAPRVQ
jgi:hypothetical protein